LSLFNEIRLLQNGGIKLSFVTTNLSTQIKVELEAIQLSALLKERTQQANLPAYTFTLTLFYAMMNVMQGSCEHGRRQRGTMHIF